MRKLFALVATVAMVLSMFAGIAFAAATDAYVVTGGTARLTTDSVPFLLSGTSVNLPGITVTKNVVAFATIAYIGVKADATEVALDSSSVALTPATADLTDYVAVKLKDTTDNYVFATLPIATVSLTETSIITTGSVAGLKNVSGYLVSKLNGSVLNYTAANLISLDGAATISVTNGAFITMIRTDGAIQRYTFSVGNSTQYFYRKAVVELDTTTIAMDADKPVAITATLRDANGNALKVANFSATPGTNTLCFDGSTTDVVIGAASQADGTLVIVLQNWLTAGAKNLNLNNVPSATLTIGKISSLGISSSKSSGFYYNVPNKFVLTLTGPASGTATLAVTGSVGAQIAAMNAALTACVVNKGGYAAGTVTFNADGVAEIVVAPVFTAADTLTLTMSIPNYKDATLGVRVVKPVAGVYTSVIGKKLDEMTVGTANITVGIAGNDFRVVKISDTGADISNIVVGTENNAITYSVYVNGALVTDKVTGTEFNKLANGNFDLTATGLGTKTVRFVAYVDGVKKIDQSYTVQTTGWNVTYDVKTMRVNEKQNVVFTVADKNSNSISNAYIYIDDVLKINPTTTNIVNGTYTVKDLKYTSVGTHKIQVKKSDNTVMASFTTGITVLGTVSYTATADVETLLLGDEQTVVLNVKDANGNTIIPTRVWMQVGTGAPTEVASANISSTSTGIKVKVTPTSTKDIVLRPGTATGDKIAEVTLKVVAPKLVALDGNAKITENVNSVVKFQIVDPRDNTVLDGDLTMDIQNFTSFVVKSANGDSVLDTNLTGADEQSVMLLASKVDWTIDETPQVTLSIKLDAASPVDVDGAFVVGKAALTSTPESLVFGQGANLVLSYKDANGNGIAGKKLYLGSDATGTYLGKTDVNGQFTYVAAASGTTAFAVATDNTEVTTLNVPVGFDAVAPVVTVPATTDKSTATITVTDNVRIVRVMINGVEDTAFFPGATYTKNVNLVSGVNTFTVQAMDANYNTLNQTVTITYTPAAASTVTLSGASVENKSGTTFVQVSKFEELGATKSWNAATKTATFTCNGKTVEVTIGSTTAKVNGVNVTMPKAPYIANGFTMVPTRFISENLGWTVVWANGAVTITLN